MVHGSCFKELFLVLQSDCDMFPEWPLPKWAKNAFLQSAGVNMVVN